MPERIPSSNPTDGPPSNSGLCHVSDQKLVLEGALDRDVLGPFCDGLDRLVNSVHQEVIVDFSRCSYLSSLVIGHLVDGILRCRANGKKVRVNVSKSIGRFFEQAHLNHLFEFVVQDSEQDSEVVPPVAT